METVRALTSSPLCQARKTRLRQRALEQPGRGYLPTKPLGTWDISSHIFLSFPGLRGQMAEGQPAVLRDCGSRHWCHCLGLQVSETYLKWASATMGLYWKAISERPRDTGLIAPCLISLFSFSFSTDKLTALSYMRTNPAASWPLGLRIYSKLQGEWIWLSSSGYLLVRRSLSCNRKVAPRRLLRAENTPLKLSIIRLSISLQNSVPLYSSTLCCDSSVAVMMGVAQTTRKGFKYFPSHQH